MEINATNIATHNTYGGLIYPSDFDLDYTGTRNIASRIMADWVFDNQCKKNAKFRDKKYKEKKNEV